MPAAVLHTRQQSGTSFTTCARPGGRPAVPCQTELSLSGVRRGTTGARHCSSLHFCHGYGSCWRTVEEQGNHSRPRLCLSPCNPTGWSQPAGQKFSALLGGRLEGARLAGDCKARCSAGMSPALGAQPWHSSLSASPWPCRLGPAGSHIFCCKGEERDRRRSRAPVAQRVGLLAAAPQPEAAPAGSCPGQAGRSELPSIWFPTALLPRLLAPRHGLGSHSSWQD